MNTKAQTLFMIGVALFVMAGIIVYVSLSSPGVYKEVETLPQTSASQSLAVDEKAKSSISQEETTAKYKTETNVTYPLNINTATIDELVTISGLGESRASAIIEYREYLGGYTSVEQIKEISGIGESTYAKLAPYLTV
ncbi:helix-hairpin-helix domain-containing protein [uncultured Eubacterium sp.]|uniref:ComEA family DNA-binding protein n=1 Tax=uncultured Eubacterium sp. TaxID=165185 RepID=UPI002627FDB1|nr:helix-hairpin-helix domain-containing protein [uncultured Eubacterium sp.]